MAKLLTNVIVAPSFYISTTVSYNQPDTTIYNTTTNMTTKRTTYTTNILTTILATNSINYRTINQPPSLFATLKVGGYINPTTVIITNAISSRISPTNINGGEN